jgi:hypothetical protein
MAVTIIFTFIKAFADVFFPYLARVSIQAHSQIFQLGKSLLIIFWSLCLVGYFPVTVFINYYLPRYTDSLNIIQILLCMTGFLTIIRILHVNYYKLLNKQKQYFLSSLIVLVLLVIVIFVSIKIWGTLQSVAVATVVAFGLWYIVNEMVLKVFLKSELKSIIKNTCIILCCIAIFYITASFIHSFLYQMLLYFCSLCLITVISFSHELKELRTMVKNISK